MIMTKALEIEQLVAELQAARDERDELQSAHQVLEQTASDQTRHLDALRYRIDRMAERQRELRRLLLEAHDELLRRDEELLAGFRREIEPKDEEIAWLREVVADHERELEAMKATRVWRMGGYYWRMRDAVKRVLRPRSRR
jgi:hypothetical protein